MNSKVGNQKNRVLFSKQKTYPERKTIISY